MHTITHGVALCPLNPTRCVVCLLPRCYCIKIYHEGLRFRSVLCLSQKGLVVIMITVDTKLIGLLGNPLRQSLSTRMQNAAFRACSLDFEYFPIETTETSLDAIVRGICHMRFAGFGVTKPDKVAIIKHLDQLDDFAAKMGAVNTVVIEPDGSLTGYNTDGVGFLRSLGEYYQNPLCESTFLCLGAGGAARAICGSLAHQGAKKITVSSLFDTDSEQLVNEINAQFAPVVGMVPWDDKKAIQAAAGTSDVIINATGVGMGAHVGESPVNPDVFHAGMLAFDAAYNPAVTKFLIDAKAKGCGILNGLGMLLYQGAAQFEIWTGAQAPTDLMRQTLEACIGDKG